MNDHEFEIRFRAWSREEAAEPPSPGFRQSALALPSTTPQQRGWLPPLTGRFQSMFSATKFVGAGFVVAVFGGFLLAGALTTQRSEEQVPAAVSPSATTMTGLLSGVDLMVEEVERGVYRVVDDGVRDLAAQEDATTPYGDANSLVVSQDGGVWRIGPDREFFRLGDPATHLWTDEPALVGDEDIEIAPDGTVWSANEWRPDGGGKGMHLMAYDGASWTDEGVSRTGDDGLSVWQVEIGPDGSVWALGSGGLYLREAAAWTRWPKPFGVSLLDRFHISDDGTRWFVGSGTSIWRDKSDWRDADPTWEAVPFGFPEQVRPSTPQAAQSAMAPNGTMWIHADGGRDGEALLARFDGDEWSSWGEADGVPSHIQTESWFGLAMTAANDGSVWLVSGERDDDGAVCEKTGSSSDQRVSRFDGTAWSHHLDGSCIHALDVTPDGAAWVRASKPGVADGLAGIYVITPEAVAAAEAVAIEPAASVEPLTDDSTTPDLLPGLELVTEEVQPGVFRIASDGVRDLTSTMRRANSFGRLAIVAGLDGSIWWIGGDELIKLGDATGHAWPGDTARYAIDEEFMVGADGTLWRSIPHQRPGAFGPGYSLWEFDGESWTRRQAAGELNVYRADTGSGGRTYVSTGAGVYELSGSEATLVSPLRDHGERPPGVNGSDLVVTDDGTRWLIDEQGLGFFRDRGDGWESIDTTGLLDRLPGDLSIDRGRGVRADAAGDGTIWASIIPISETEPIDIGWLARFDGAGWVVWDASDGLPDLFRGDLLNRVHAAPDGSVWAQPRDSKDDTDCRGIAHFDGTAWTRYLDGLCVIAYDVAPDGAVWLQAGVSLDRATDGPVSTYVITPEAVASNG